MNMTTVLEARTGKPLTGCTNQEIYLALLDLVREQSAANVKPVTGRKLYYISAEFLIGKLLSNNLINLGLYDDVRTALAAAGKSLSDIEEVEPEPSLGNGGLGRLAACFLDSLATLNLPGDGVGLRYHFGLFHQSFEGGVQNELPDPWLTAHSWAEKTDTVYPVELAGKTYNARLYKLAVTGYEGRTNTLNLFDLDTIDETIVHDGITFDKTAIDKNLTLFLYPDDSDEAGRRLRIYQQYLMVSAGAQLILAECAARGCNYHDLADYAAIQINDTHPSMVIPELIRLLGEKGIAFEEAVKIVTKTCAYTNHTILAEALEKWPRAYLDAVVPQLMPIIEQLDALARSRTADESLAIIDKDNRVHMAHMDIHFTHSTNGVAYLHTEILKNSELHGFYELYPEKFNNKTNGITFRRWLLECDPALTLGTMDGANVEISQQVGNDNIYIFGQTSDQVIHRYAMGDYNAAQWVEGDPNIRRAVDFLVSPEMLAAGREENLRRLHDELVLKDWFQTLPDFNAYVVRKGQALSDYACDPLGWRKKCIINIAKAGMFSSDRTIAEYDKDIWHLGE